MASCPSCQHQLVEGHCELCTARRHIAKVEQERDQWFTRATQAHESAEKRKAWALKMEAQVRAAGLEPEPAEEVV